MSHSKKYSAYGLANETVGKARQVVMLYDGMIKFTKQARQAITEKRIQDRFNNLERACKILLGLQASLDFANGGKIAHILNHFYSTLDIRLMSLNQTNNLENCDGIIEDLKKMRGAWATVESMNENSTEDAAAELPPLTEGAFESSIASIAVSI